MSPDPRPFGPRSEPTSRESQPVGAEARCASRRRLARGTHWAYASEPDEDNPARQLRLGFDTTGRMLEIVVLHFDSGNELIIHAMKARSTYLALLD